MRSRVDVTLIINVKGYHKLVGKTSFISQKIFNENFVAVHKIKEVLTPNKTVHICVNSVYAYITFEQKYYLQTLMVWYMNLKQMMYMKIFTEVKRCLILVNIQKVWFYDLTNKTVIVKMNYVFIHKILRRIHTQKNILNESDKKAKGINKNGVKNMNH